MGKFIAILFVLYGTGISAVAQQAPVIFSVNIQKADSLLATKQYLSAAKFYNKAFRNKAGYSIDYYRLFSAFCWDKAGYKDSAFVDLYMLVYGFSYADPDYFISFFKSSEIRNDPEFKKVSERCLLNQRIKKLPFNATLGKLLDSVYLIDQSTRSLQGKNIVSNDLVVLPDSQHRNLKLVDSIFNEFGWLAYSQVGHNAAMAQFLVIQHSDLKTQKKWLPRIKRAVAEGLLQPDNLGLLEDRILIQSGKKQLYGTQMSWDPLKKIYVPFEIENPKLVNIRRAKMGMIGLLQYLDNYNN